MSVLAAAPRYVPSPTAEAFILSVREGPAEEIRMLTLSGPRGEGKTSAGIVACAALAGRVREMLGATAEALLPIRVAVVRDTWANLERTTLESFREGQRRGMPVHVFDGGHQATFGEGREDAHFWFFGFDNDADVDKLQGFQCAVLWLEEVAPAAGVSTGVPEGALTIGRSSVRQPSVPKRILLTMNPPEEDHWAAKITETLARLGLRSLKVAEFEMRPGEKSAHFQAMAELAETPEEADEWRAAATEFDVYREQMAGFLSAGGRPDLVARLVHGQRAMIVQGEAVVPEFARNLHVAKEPLPIVPFLPVIRLWDSGTPNLHPAICWIQCGPGWLNVLGSRTGENIGLVQLIQEQVLPFQQKYGLMPAKASRRQRTPAEGHDRGLFFGETGFVVAEHGGRGGYDFRDIGDPACLVPEGTNSLRTVALEIQAMLGTSFEPGPQDWNSRHEALRVNFRLKGPGGRMRIMIDPTENDLLIKALGGRFHFPKGADGRIIGTVAAAKRASGIASHAVDALAYGLAILFPAEEQHRPPKAPPGPPRGAPKSFLGV